MNKATYEELLEAATRFGLKLPCTQQEVNKAFPLRLTELKMQDIPQDLSVNQAGDPMDALLAQAAKDRQILLRQGENPPLPKQTPPRPSPAAPRPAATSYTNSPPPRTTVYGNPAGTYYRVDPPSRGERLLAILVKITIFTVRLFLAGFHLLRPIAG